jgi:ribonuclease VapC
VKVAEAVEALLRQGASFDAVEAMLDALHLDVRPHDRQDAFSAATLVEVTKHFGAGIGGRSCMALVIAHTLPARTMDKEWAHIDAPGLTVFVAR